MADPYDLKLTLKVILYRRANPIADHINILYHIL